MNPRDALASLALHNATSYDRLCHWADLTQRIVYMHFTIQMN